MVRSISEVPLFKDNDDKDKYLRFIQKYQEQFGFKVYGYCLMTTHGHFIIDANGADVSKFMHGINLSYATYYNVRHGRHGHLFQDRFKSVVVDSESYLFNLSAYIHNNATDIPGYETCPEKFKYSTLGLYLGLAKDKFGIVDEEFVLGFFSEKIKRAREKYYSFVMACNDESMIEHYEFLDETSEYRSERTVLERKFKPGEVMKFIEEYANVDEKMLRWKYKRGAKECRALCVFLIRYYCDYSYKQVCGILGRLTLTRVSELGQIGHKLIKEDEKYKNIMEDFIRYKTA